MATDDNVLRQSYIEHLAKQVCSVLEVQEKLQPHELRAIVGLDTSRDSMTSLRDAMAVLSRDRRARWDASSMSWLYLPPA